MGQGEGRTFSRDPVGGIDLQQDGGRGRCARKALELRWKLGLPVGLNRQPYFRRRRPNLSKKQYISNKNSVPI